MNPAKRFVFLTRTQLTMQILNILLKIISHICNFPVKVVNLWLNDSTPRLLRLIGVHKGTDGGV